LRSPASDCEEPRSIEHVALRCSSTLLFLMRLALLLAIVGVARGPLDSDGVAA